MHSNFDVRDARNAVIYNSFAPQPENQTNGGGSVIQNYGGGSPGIVGQVGLCTVYVNTIHYTPYGNLLFVLS